MSESFFEPSIISRIKFPIQKIQHFNQRWQNTTLNSNKWISGVIVTEFAFAL